VWATIAIYTGVQDTAGTLGIRWPTAPARRSSKAGRNGWNSVRKKPYFVVIAPRIGLGYRRNQGTGVWVVRAADGAGGNWTKAFGAPDDHEQPNGESVLTYWQAQDRARALARRGETTGDRPATVAESLNAYENDLRARGGDVENASRIRFNLPDTLGAKTVSLLGAGELRRWRDGLVRHGMSPAAADRTARALKACLNLAAGDDPRIVNATAWKTGLKRLPDAERARNVILSDDQVRAIVGAAYVIDRAFGLLIELAAVTGARASQLLRLRVDDLQNGPAARLMLPSSRKGRRRSIERKPLPIPSGLAMALQEAAGDRRHEAPLLVRADGSRWANIDLVLFRRVAAQAGCDSSVTPYALRHSSIVRSLLAGVPARVVASLHDTSVAMLEKTYSKHIVGDPSDAIVRRGLLDMGPPPAGNVVPWPAKG
jgi:integrase